VTFSKGGITIPAAKAERVARSLEPVLRWWMQRGRTPPVETVELYNDALACAEWFRAVIAAAPKPQAEAISGDAIAPGGTGPAALEQGGIWLTCTEAAARACCTPRHVRYLCQERAVEAERTAAGMWRVSAVSLEAYVQRREETKRKA
jgi:hypothetical protein